MTLSEWVAQNRDEVLPEPTSRQEIRGLLAVIDRELLDAGAVPSLDGKFSHVFWASLMVARTALRASGYRLRSTAHHYKAIESLEYTLGLDSAQLLRLQAYRAKWARAEYETAGLVTEVELEEASDLAKTLRQGLNDWLHREHPDLIP